MKSWSALWLTFLVFLRLGLTAFGGPIAHLAYFRNEFVQQRKWLSEQAYAELVALCQFIPGPASSQVGIALGLGRAGIFGAIAAWVGFTLPSAIIMVLFALGISKFTDAFGYSWLHGLKVFTVAVVAQALLAMGRTLCPDRLRAAFALVAAILVLSFPHAAGQIAVIVVGGIAGRLFLHNSIKPQPYVIPMARLSKMFAISSLLLFFGLLVLLPIAVKYFDIPALQQIETFYRAGSLVFGGGHVVLPLLQTEVISSGSLTNDIFLAGYGAAQALPGPLFTFAAYLGANSSVQPSGWLGAALCLLAIFLPAFLLLFGVLPLWERVRSYKGMISAVQGINAAVVGLLLAAFYDPVWTSAIHNKSDFVLATIAFLLLVIWKIPPWLLVILTACAGRAIDS
ncbi:MAG: chromate efflux transporter [Oligoflexales bacterium]|nr:chromate efflux transporter [Oligoflexales bacterium]